jgi:hypothetical protein
VQFKGVSDQSLTEEESSFIDEIIQLSGFDIDESVTLEQFEFILESIQDCCTGKVLNKKKICVTPKALATRFDLLRKKLKRENDDRFYIIDGICKAFYRIKFRNNNNNNN